LGLTVIPFDPAHRSVSKGETLEDTIKTIGAIGVNIAVMRHAKDGYYKALISCIFAYTFLKRVPVTKTGNNFKNINQINNHETIAN
ncbi:MAG: hypothetical protein ACFN1E_07515, partial [Prevotella melaninogenica]